MKGSAALILYLPCTTEILLAPQSDQTEAQLNSIEQSENGLRLE